MSQAVLENARLNQVLIPLACGLRVAVGKISNESVTFVRDGGVAQLGAADGLSGPCTKAYEVQGTCNKVMSLSLSLSAS